MKSLITVILAGLVVAGCEATGPGSPQATRFAVREEVARVFIGGCMQQMKNLSQSRQALVAQGMTRDHRQGGTIYFSDKEKGIIASSGDFSVTQRTGGVTVGTVSGYTCFVGSPVLGRVGANDIVDRVRASFISARGVGHGYGKTDGFNRVTVSKEMIGKSFEIVSISTFLKFDEAQTVEVEGSRTVTIEGLPLSGVAITVFDQ